MLLAPVMFVAVYELRPDGRRGFACAISADYESAVSVLMICCSGCAALAGQPWCRSDSRVPVLGRCGLAGGDVLHRWRRCARDLVQGARTSSSKPLSTRVDSVGADPRQRSIRTVALKGHHRGLTFRLPNRYRPGRRCFPRRRPMRRKRDGSSRIAGLVTASNTSPNGGLFPRQRTHRTWSSTRHRSGEGKNRQMSASR
jgi:hypothetical protein